MEQVRIRGYRFVVLTVADKVDMKDKLSGIQKIEHSVIKAQDMPSYQIRKHFAEGNKFIS